MTKEEIQQRRAFCGKVAGLPTTGQAIKAIALDALDALEEAHREIERLGAVAKKLGAWDCEKCQRLFVESMLTISPHSAVCDSCLGESTT